jgi:hypothetical protein
MSNLNAAYYNKVLRAAQQLIESIAVLRAIIIASHFYQGIEGIHTVLKGVTEAQLGQGGLHGVLIHKFHSLEDVIQGDLGRF